MKPWMTIFFALLITACSEDKPAPKQPPKPVKAMTIRVKNELQTLSFVGKVEANIRAELSFEVSGKLEKLPVLEGDNIKTGQLLASIATKRYQDAVDEATATYQLAKAQFQRAAKLVTKNYISRSDYDILKSKMKVAAANLSLAKKNLKDTSIYAPFNGVVAKVFVDNHEYIKAKMPMMIVHDLDKIDVEIQIPDYIAKQVNKEHSHKADSKAYAIFENYPNVKVPLTFKEFSSKADNNTQTYRVVFSMKSPKEINVLPGMSLTVKIDVPDFKNMKQAFYLIPASSVFSGMDKQPNVWLIDIKTSSLKAVTIKTANLTGDKIKVLSGLKPGDQIVTAGVHFLRKGQKVKPITKIGEN